MDFRIADLKNFLRATKFKTLTEAASAAGITQPSLSQSIKRLEKNLNLKLFYRTRSGIKLTPDGRVCLETSSIALKLLNEVGLLAQSRDSSSFGGRSINIGCHPAVASYALPQALLLLSQKAQDFRLNIIHKTSRQIEELVQSGNVDLGIVVNSSNTPDTVVKTVATDYVHVWSRDGSQDHMGRIFCDMNLFQTQSILRKWKNHSFEIINTNSLELVARFVEAGIGFGIIPARVVHLMKVKIKKHNELPRFRDRISIVYRPEFGKNILEKSLIENIGIALSNQNP